MSLRAFAEAWHGDGVNEILETVKNIAGHECWLSCFGERRIFPGGVECHYVLGGGAATRRIRQGHALGRRPSPRAFGRRIA